MAWFPLERVFIEKNIEWDPEYHLVTEFYGLRVYAKDTESILTFEYTGGNEKMVFHMDINTGNILENENMIGYEDLKYIRHTVEHWYDSFKDKLLDDYRNGGYNILLDYEEENDEA